MQDRVPLYAGRVQLTPVSGNIYDMSMADQPQVQGTPLNKATFLKDATAALYGLTNTAVPDDVLAWIGTYNQHWWRRRTVSYRAEAVFTPITSEVEVRGSSAKTISTSSSVSVNPQTLEVSLQNPTSFSVSSGSAGGAALAALSPKYLTNLSGDASGIYYIPSGATSGTSASNTVHTSSTSIRLGNTASLEKRASKVTAQTVTVFGEWEFLHDVQSGAYPESGISGGYEYQYLGVPFDKLKLSVSFESGSYIGTGMYGQGNPNEISFAFVPVVIMIEQESSTQANNVADRSERLFIFQWDAFIRFGGGNASYNNTITRNGTILQWYFSGDSEYASAANQGNTAGATYHYFAIGYGGESV